MRMHGPPINRNSLPVATGCDDTDALLRVFISLNTYDFSPERLENISLATFGLEHDGVRASKAFSNAYRFLIKNDVLLVPEGV